MIPLYKSYSDEADVEAVSKVIRRGTGWAEGSEIEEFEGKLINYLGIPGVLVCNSGTSALHLALLSSGVKHFHEVIVPSFTFIATANAVKFIGAKPVFADIEEVTYGLDPEDVESKITSHTKAIIAVHYAGCPCRIRELKGIAKKYDLILIEDAAEALGADTNGLKVTKYGDCSILSFCANKIISTGEGGALVTEDKYIYDKAKLLRSHGRNESDNFISLGYNFRMSTMTAALGCSQMSKVESLIEKRQQIAKWYEEYGVTGFNPPDNYRHVYQLYTIRTPKRDLIQRTLKDNDIISKVYFYPIHQSGYYRKQTWDVASLPITEKVSSEVLSLPMYPDLIEEEVKTICQIIKSI